MSDNFVRNNNDWNYFQSVVNIYHTVIATIHVAIVKD